MTKIVARPCPIKPQFSIFISFTRPWAVVPFFEAFKKMVVPYDQTELVIAIDSNDKSLIGGVKEQAKSLPFLGVTFGLTGNPPPIETRINLRRDRIVQMKEFSKSLVGDSVYTFGFEDDTLVSPNTFTNLMFAITGQPNAGYVTGVQTGRWSYKYLGLWRTDDLLHPTEYYTLDQFKTEAYSNIDAGGFYGYVTPTELYKAAHYFWSEEFLGPDVNYALGVRSLGFQSYVDWSCPLPHMTTKDHCLLPQQADVSLKWRKENGIWQLEMKKFGQNTYIKAQNIGQNTPKIDAK